MAYSNDKLRRIGLVAAEGLYDVKDIIGLDVSAGADADGDPSYFFNFVINQDHDRTTALDRRLKLRHEIRDRLIAEADETYPYVLIFNHSAEVPVG